MYGLYDQIEELKSTLNQNITKIVQENIQNSQHDQKLFQPNDKEPAPPTNINDSFHQQNDVLDRDLDDDSDGPPLRTFTFSGNSPFIPEMTQEEKIAEAVNTAVVGISKTYTDKITSLE